MNKWSAVAILLGSVLLSGCSAQPTLSEDEKDKVFLETVRDRYPDSAAKDRTLLTLADAACAAFDSGASKTDIIDVILESGGDSGEEIGFAIGAGVPIYCPKHRHKL